MDQESEQIVQALRAKGLRVTPQRFAVYANLLNRFDHPTAEDILKDLNQAAPTSSQATVYSSLQALRQVNLVREVLLEEGVRRYDANVDPHHHFQCQNCGQIADIAWDALAHLDLGSLSSGWQIKGYEVTVHGVCDRCQAQYSHSSA
ncbi:MAG: Fur family transcriptional regulator [Cyanobacteriota bacterium]|nr:Fur family transcriptional regulator [Cyanobacteriota bacterium]